MKKIKDISTEEAIMNNLIHLQQEYRKRAMLKVTAVLVLAFSIFGLVMAYILTVIPKVVDKWLGM